MPVSDAPYVGIETAPQAHLSDTNFPGSTTISSSKFSFQAKFSQVSRKGPYQVSSFLERAFCNLVYICSESVSFFGGCINFHNILNDSQVKKKFQVPNRLHNKSLISQYKFDKFVPRTTVILGAPPSKASACLLAPC